MILCYYFGLRISESLGLTEDKFREFHLLVDEQGERILNGKITRKGTKSQARKVPYWFMDAQSAWDQVKLIKVQHPDTLTRKVNECLDRFGHKSHDFRKSFITNAFRLPGIHWKDVQRAAGHSDVRVTMAYDRDDRGLNDKKASLK